MTTYKTCIFCNRNDSRPTNEDIFADWIAREFPNPSLTWETSTREGPILYKSKRNKIGLKSNRVCQRCNNGWMSQLESAAKPVLSPLIHGRKRILSLHNQLTITKWFAKTAAMFDAHIKGKTYFTQSERQAIMSSLAPTKTTWVFLACYRGSHIGDIVTRSSFLHDQEKPLPENDHDLFKADGYAFTLLIKHLALQIFSFRWPKELVGTFNLEMPARWEDATVRIIPPEKDVYWPPPLVFDDAGFEEFAMRWGELRLTR
ncbi:MAG: hypothetical protein ABR594_06655 [Pyrinomonadaceae bacterium]